MSDEMDAPLTVGLDVGGTKVLGVVATPDGDVLASRLRPTPGDGPGLLAALAEVTDELRDEVPGVTAVGVGLPGLVDRSGVLRFAPNLPGVEELAVVAALASHTGLPVAADNDATCALRGEHAFGAAAGADHAVLVAFGTGIGAGLLVDGRVHRGANGFAGEAGHMVVDRGGLPCSCGRRGCWERYASGTGLGRMAREAAEAGRAPRLVALAGGDPLAVRGEHVTVAAGEGDPVAVEVVATFADWVAVGLVNLTQLLDVERFVIAGGIAESAGVFLEPIRHAYRERIMAPTHRPGVEILVAAMGGRAGAIGASLLAR